MSAIQTQTSPSTSVVKPEFAAPPQPPTAAFSCEYCDRKFQMKRYLVRHAVESHGDSCLVKSEPPSSQSGTTYPSSYSLHGESNNSVFLNFDITQPSSTTNIPLHSVSNRQFSCKVCQKNFKTSSNLKTHLLIHSGVTPHSCQVCQRSFR
eukprot:254937_1